MSYTHGYTGYVFGADGTLAKRVDLDCVDDDTAKAQTLRLAAGAEAEVWHGSRLVCVFRRRTTAE